jgi:hypothetical protein
MLLTRHAQTALMPRLKRSITAEPILPLMLFQNVLARISHQLFATGFESVESPQCILTLSPPR